jgi:hypothetical protein
MVTKYKHREITSFEECATNIQRLLVDFFSNLVTPEYFEKREVEEKKGFDYFDNLLKKDAIVAKIILFLSTDRK